LAGIAEVISIESGKALQLVGISFERLIGKAIDLLLYPGQGRQGRDRGEVVIYWRQGRDPELIFQIIGNPGLDGAADEGFGNGRAIEGAQKAHDLVQVVFPVEELDFLIDNLSFLCKLGQTLPIRRHMGKELLVALPHQAAKARGGGQAAELEAGEEELADAVRFRANIGIVIEIGRAHV